MKRLSQTILGAKYLWKGFGFLLKRPSLWPWVSIPLLIAIVILAFSWGVFVHYYPDFYHLLLSKIGFSLAVNPEGFWANLGYAGLWLLQQILKLLLFLLGLILLSIISFLVYLIVAAPFLDLLAEKVTTLSQNLEPPLFQFKRFFKNSGRIIWIEMQKALLFLIGASLLWLLHFIPVAGSFLYTLATSLFGMWALGFISVDYPMGHQLFSFRKRLSFARRFKYALTGFGFPFLIPFAPLLLQAPMVVGGTLLYFELDNESRILLSYKAE